ncbi:zinc-finger domain-containing protein [Aureimonas leprariae]|uniref:Zinc-finger domain-containing protein n=1 Tax=Plantimonas leprariae TaxID=2615207 RepID=A0A7V7PQU4_9HYPH|nr:zinc-finger domain-containing protein [Aureimonas leprariae]KAB0680764.1 zinc-finger domain-containing protein [Aureimonas leprariae]
MADHLIPHFQNDGGYDVIEIGVTEFMCTGASAPFDHPHVYLDMGDEGEKVCGYCSTLYRIDPSLKAAETRPAGCLFEERAT